MKQMKYALLILLLLSFTHTQQEEGINPVDPTPSPATKDYQIRQNQQKVTIQPEIPNHNKPYLENTHVKPTTSDDPNSQKATPSTQSSTIATSKANLNSVLNKSIVERLEDERRPDAAPSIQHESVAVHTPDEKKIPKETVANLKATGSEKLLKTEQQIPQKEPKVTPLDRQKLSQNNIYSEVPKALAPNQEDQTTSLKDQTQGTGKENLVLEQKQQQRNKMQEDRTIKKRPIKTNEYTKSAPPPEDEETIVIKPANKTKIQQDNIEQRKQEGHLVPFRKEISEIKKGSKVDETLKEVQQQNVLKNRQFQKVNHNPQEETQPKQIDITKTSPIQNEELHHQARLGQESIRQHKDSEAIQKEKGKQAVPTQTSQQFARPKPQSIESKDNDHKIKIVPLQTLTLEEDIAPTNMGNPNHQSDKTQHSQKQISNLQQQVQELLVPPYKKEKLEGEGKDLRDKDKHFQQQAEVKESNLEVKSKVHQEKIQKLIEEVKNTKGELAEDSKKQIIKYLQAGKGLNKETEPKVADESTKPMIKVQKSASKEDNPAEQQLTVQHTKEPQQMDTTTIVFIIVLTFVISIPIVKQIRRNETHEVCLQSINQKTSLDVEKVDSQKVQDLIDYNAVTNSSGYDTGQRLDQIFN